MRLSQYHVIKASVPKGLNFLASMSVRFITQVFTVSVVYLIGSVGYQLFVRFMKWK